MKKNLLALLMLIPSMSLLGLAEQNDPIRSPSCGAVYGIEGKNKTRVSITGAVSHPGIYFLESIEDDLESLVDKAKPKGMICPKSGAFHAPWLRSIAIYRFFPNEEVSTKKMEVDFKKLKEESIHLPLQDGDMIYVGYTMGI
jgi:hypothetical protein